MQGRDYTPPHTASYLRSEHICCCPVKHNKHLNKYVLKPKFVVHTHWLKQPRLQVRSVGGIINTCFQWAFEVEDWKTRQLILGGLMLLLLLVVGVLFNISEEQQKFVRQNWTDSLLAKQQNNESEQMFRLNFQLPQNKPELTSIKLFLWA